MVNPKPTSLVKGKTLKVNVINLSDVSQSRYLKTPAECQIRCQFFRFEIAVECQKVKVTDTVLSINNRLRVISVATKAQKQNGVNFHKCKDI